MKIGPAQDLLRAQDKLARTRQALLLHLRVHVPGTTSNDAGPDQRADQGGVWQVLRLWWQEQVAQEPWALMTAALRSSLRSHPVHMLALAAGLGLALVCLRPWRMLPWTTLVMAAIRRLPMAELLAAWRDQASGRSEATDAPGRSHAAPPGGPVDAANPAR